jgi:Tfp pilus assembly protein PilF
VAPGEPLGDPWRNSLGQGDQQKSLEPLVDWLQFQPGDVRTRSVYATLLQQYGNNDKAMAEYETILQQSPDNILVLNNLAWLYQLNNDRRAIELSERAFQLAPDKPEIVDTYGWILVNFGDYEKGLAYLKDAFAKMPENPEVAFHVGYALSKSGNKEEAKKVLRRIVRDHKESPYAEKAKALELSLD